MTAGEGDVGTDDERGYWVRRIEVAPIHECSPPVWRSKWDTRSWADAKAGELWRCDCGRLWECYEAHPGVSGVSPALKWRPAGPYLRLRYSELWRSPLLPALLAAAVAGLFLAVAAMGGPFPS